MYEANTYLHYEYRIDGKYLAKMKSWIIVLTI